jgi:hypothetical protein
MTVDELKAHVEKVREHLKNQGSAIVMSSPTDPIGLSSLEAVCETLIAVDQRLTLVEKELKRLEKKPSSVI